MSTYEKKFAGLIRLIAETKGTNVGSVIVASPTVLGDNYEELVESLRRISVAELQLIIVPPRRADPCDPKNASESKS